MDFKQNVKIKLLKASVALLVCFLLIIFSCQKDEFPGRATIGIGLGLNISKINKSIIIQPMYKP
jgi:hypothetical protein